MPFLLLQTDAQRRTSETGRWEGIIHVISTRMDFVNGESLLSHALMKPLIISIIQLWFNNSLARPDCVTWWRTLKEGSDLRWPVIVCQLPVSNTKRAGIEILCQKKRQRVGLVAVHPDNHLTVFLKNQVHSESFTVNNAINGCDVLLKSLRVWNVSPLNNQCATKLLCKSLCSMFNMYDLWKTCIWWCMGELREHFLTATSLVWI